MGVSKTERILGLHRRPCRHCTPRSARLVTERRWSIGLLGVPVLALDARWRRCTGCARRAAMPRLSLSTVVLATLVLSMLLGLDAVAYGDLFVWVLLAGFWGVWLTGHLVDAFLDRTLIPVPPSAYRTHARASTSGGAKRRAAKSRAAHRPVGRWTRYARIARMPLRAAHRVQAHRRAHKTLRSNP